MASNIRNPPLSTLLAHDRHPLVSKNPQHQQDISHTTWTLPSEETQEVAAMCDDTEGLRLFTFMTMAQVI